MKKATLKTLQQQAEETKYPPRWPDGEEPQELVGWFVGRRVLDTQYGDWTLYRLMREDGVIVELNGSHRYLSRKLEAQEVETYDLVYVSFEGLGKTRKGKPPYLYSVAVLGREDEGYEIPDSVDEAITDVLSTDDE